MALDVGRCGDGALGTELTPFGAVEVEPAQPASRSVRSKPVDFVAGEAESAAFVTGDRGVIVGKDDERDAGGVRVGEGHIEQSVHKPGAQPPSAAAGSDNHVSKPSAGGIGARAADFGVRDGEGFGVGAEDVLGIVVVAPRGDFIGGERGEGLGGEPAQFVVVEHPGRNDGRIGGGERSDSGSHGDDCSGVGRDGPECRGLRTGVGRGVAAGRGEMEWRMRVEPGPGIRAGGMCGSGGRDESPDRGVALSAPPASVRSSQPPGERRSARSCTKQEPDARRRRRRRAAFAVSAAVALSAAAAPAYGYVGPGAGFAVLSSLFVVFAATASAMLALATWPMRWVVRRIRSRRALGRSRIERCVVVGLDGMDPDLVDGYLARGMLPNLARMVAAGSYRRLGTTAPPLSPVAWSSFTTGSNPGKHGIFDFLTYDRKTYVPTLSSVRIGPARRTLKVGKYRIPIGRPELRGLRRGKAFWQVLGEHGIFSAVIRVPITFPPERLNGVLLSAMCVPDIRGTQGTYSLVTTRTGGGDGEGSGEVVRVRRSGNRMEGELTGPPNPLVAGCPPVRIGFRLELEADGEGARLGIDGRRVSLVRGVYSEFVTVRFRLAPGVRVSGVCRFLLRRARPELELYVTPIQIDPERPAMPISHPPAYSVYLAKKQGLFATLGLVEDTSALNDGALDDGEFLEQCLAADGEREAMFLDALGRVRRGLCVGVFDGTDRIQHMFWRYLEPDHPARKEPGSAHAGAIEAHYRRCDELVGRVMRQCDDEGTLLFVISDHGFKSFRRCVDLNRWLMDTGYMAVKPVVSGDKYLVDVDWERTRAFAVGLAGIYLNVKGREGGGIVEAGEEADALREELCARLTGLTDADGSVAISRAYDARDVYRGPYSGEGPDVIVGYGGGYRVSWDTAAGRITETVFSDNTKAWSGDHCIDPKLVPGVMFCNRKVRSDGPRLMDIGPTAMNMFGVAVPAYMDGKAMMVADADGRFPEQVAAA